MTQPRIGMWLGVRHPDVGMWNKGLAFSDLVYVMHPFELVMLQCCWLLSIISSVWRIYFVSICFVLFLFCFVLFQYVSFCFILFHFVSLFHALGRSESRMQDGPVLRRVDAFGLEHRVDLLLQSASLRELQKVIHGLLCHALMRVVQNGGRLR